MPKTTRSSSSSKKPPTMSTKSSMRSDRLQQQQQKVSSNSIGTARRPTTSPRTTRSKSRQKLESTGTDPADPHKLQQLPIGKSRLNSTLQDAVSSVVQGKESGLPVFKDSQSTAPPRRQRSSMSTNPMSRAAGLNGSITSTCHGSIGPASAKTFGQDAAHRGSAGESKYGVSREMQECVELYMTSRETEGDLPVASEEHNQVLHDYQQKRDLGCGGAGDGSNSEQLLRTEGSGSKTAESTFLPVSKTGVVEKKEKENEEKENGGAQAGMKRRYSLMGKGNNEIGAPVRGTGARIPLVLKSFNQNDWASKYGNRVGASQYKQKSSSGPRALLSASSFTMAELADQPDINEASPATPKAPAAPAPESRATPAAVEPNSTTCTPPTEPIPTKSVYKTKEQEFFLKPAATVVNNSNITNDPSTILGSTSSTNPPQYSISPPCKKRKHEQCIDLSINVQFVSGKTNQGASAYKLTIGFPPSSSPAATSNNGDCHSLEVSSKVSFQALPQSWFDEGSSSSQPNATKRRKTGFGFTKTSPTVDKSIPSVKLHLYIIPNLLSCLRETGQLTEIQIEIIRRTIKVFIKRTIAKYGTEAVGEIHEWGVCCVSPIYPVSGGGGGMIAEVIIRRANAEEGDWLMEKGQPEGHISGSREYGVENGENEMFAGEEEEEEEGLWGEYHEDSEIFINDVSTGGKRKRF